MFWEIARWFTVLFLGTQLAVLAVAGIKMIIEERNAPPSRYNPDSLDGRELKAWIREQNARHRAREAAKPPRPADRNS